MSDLGGLMLSTMITGAGITVELRKLMTDSGKESFTKDDISGYMTKAIEIFTDDLIKTAKGIDTENPEESKTPEQLIQEGKVDEGLDLLNQFPSVEKD